MCGIAGLFTPGHSVDPALCDAMSSALAHRGPDGRGQFVEPGVALLHTRLSIIDLDHGQQPLYSADGRQALVANGEIYNHVELRRELQHDGVSFATGSDCEVILPLARREPDRFMHRLNGMFAFALYDRDNRSLLLVRDRFGIKPLYVCQVEGGIAFASETRALLPALKDALEVDSDAIGRFLQNNFNSGLKTAIKGIERIPPGGYLRMNADGRIERGKWWDLDEEVRRQPRFVGSEEEALAQFDALLGDALTQHLRADVPVGLFLSGGVDSSILATGLSRCTDPAGAPKAWSLAFASDAVHDESETAAAVASACHLQLEPVRVDPVSLFDHLVFAIWATDELMGDFASLPTLLLARHASASHKVVLTGEGGDEVFAGYGRYRMSALQRFFYNLKAPGSGGFRTRGRFTKAAAAGLLRPNWAKTVLPQWRAPFIDAWKGSQGQDPLTRMQCTDIQTWLVDDLLVKADRMLMAHGVEGRVPFLDHRIVLFGLSLPTEYRQQGRVGKRLPRHWLEQNLPDVLQGRKRGFSVPVVDWVRTLEPSRVESALLRSPLLRSIVDETVLKQALSTLATLPKALVEPLAALIQLAIWERLFIEQRGQRPPECVDPIEWLLG